MGHRGLSINEAPSEPLADEPASEGSLPDPVVDAMDEPTLDLWAEEEVSLAFQVSPLMAAATVLIVVGLMGSTAAVMLAIGLQ